MRTLLEVLHRTFVIEYYKQNAAFFGFFLLIFFGFIKSSEHLVIGQFLVEHPVALAFASLLWILYLLKVVLFELPEIRRSENQFLAQFALFPLATRFIALTIVAVSLLMPVIAYGVFLISLAYVGGHLRALLSVFAILVVLVLLLIKFIGWQLNLLPVEKRIRQFTFLKKSTLPFTLFFTNYLLRKQLTLFFLSKAYTCCIIYGTTVLYQTDDYDNRLMATGVLLAIAGNVALVYRYLWFQYNPLHFSLNLPVLYPQIFGIQLFNFVLISIPEMVVLLRYFPNELNAPNFIGMLTFSVGINYLMYSLMLKLRKDLSEFIVPLFWMVVLTTFGILFSLPSLLLGIIFIVASMTIVYFYHYRYEYSER
jgi:hypothetical protein